MKASYKRHLLLSRPVVRTPNTSPSVALFCIACPVDPPPFTRRCLCVRDTIHPPSHSPGPQIPHQIESSKFCDQYYRFKWMDKLGSYCLLGVTVLYVVTVSMVIFANFGLPVLVRNGLERCAGAESLLLVAGQQETVLDGWLGWRLADWALWLY